jgi:hypothetical protein
VLRHNFPRVQARVEAGSQANELRPVQDGAAANRQKEIRGERTRCVRNGDKSIVLRIRRNAALPANVAGKSAERRFHIRASAIAVDAAEAKRAQNPGPGLHKLAQVLADGTLAKDNLRGVLPEPLHRKSEVTDWPNDCGNNGGKVFKMQRPKFPKKSQKTSCGRW